MSDALPSIIYGKRNSILMEKLTPKQAKRGMDYSIKDGTYTGAATGLVNVYLTPYALALGATAAQIGLLTAIPQLASTLLQPFAGSITEHVGSRKKICRAVLLISRILMVPVIGLAFLRGFDAFSLLLVFISASTALAGFSRIAWVSWMGDLVPEKIRGKYFGKRNMFVGAASLVVTLIAGRLLGLTDTMTGFAAIFSAALILYFVGYSYLGKIPEPKLYVRKHRGHKISLNVSEFLSSMKKTNFRHFMTYVVLFDFSVFLASPFFTVYMLKELNISYWWFAVLTSASALSSILSQRHWGKIADRYGNRTVMVICSTLASLVPLVFVFSKEIPLLLLANIFSGFAWAGLELVTFNFLLDSSPPLKRPLFISNYQFFDGLAVAAGASAGGALITLIGPGGLFGFSTVAAIFLLASALRATFAITLIPRIKEERVKSRDLLPVRDVFTHAVMSPVRGITHHVVFVNQCIRCWEQKAKKEMKGLSRMFSFV